MNDEKLIKNLFIFYFQGDPIKDLEVNERWLLCEIEKILTDENRLKTWKNCYEHVLQDER